MYVCMYVYIYVYNMIKYTMSLLFTWLTQAEIRKNRAISLFLWIAPYPLTQGETYNDRATSLLLWTDPI